MNIYFFISIFGGLMGLIFVFGIIYINKFKEYMEGKEHKIFWFKALDLLWRILLPVVFVTFLVISIDLFRIYFGKSNLVENLISVYIVSFVVSLFVFILVFIKLGKIKVNCNMIQKDESTKITKKRKLTLRFVRTVSIGAASILIFIIYIKRNQNYLFQSHPLLFWILLVCIFTMGAISLWLLFSQRE